VSGTAPKVAPRLAPRTIAPKSDAVAFSYGLLAATSITVGS
jgi:hypothetical protein